MTFSVQIIENAFDAALCRAAVASWPASDWHGWNAVYQAAYQRKRAANHWEDMPAPCRELLATMLLLNVSHLGLGHLVPDTGLWGGGMHSMGTGDILNLHLDASHHRLSGLERKINAILFLTPSWKPEWGGSLELWDAERTRPTLTIAPVFNRLVLFATSDTSWHGIPQPLACPADVRRMTLAIWWYGPPQTGKRDQAQFTEAAPQLTSPISLAT